MAESIPPVAARPASAASSPPPAAPAPASAPAPSAVAPVYPTRPAMDLNPQPAPGAAGALPAPRSRSAAEAVGDAIALSVQTRVETNMMLARSPAATAMFDGINNAMRWLGLPTFPDNANKK